MAVATSHASPAANGAAVTARPPRAGPRPAAVLLAALVCVLAYAVFAQGATDLPDETYAQVAVDALALLACAGCLSGRLQVPGGVRAWLGVALLAGFAAWNGVTLLWTVAPDATWVEHNRTLTYALAVAVAMAIAASLPRAAQYLGIGWLIVAALAALYALGGKVAPGVHVDDLVHLDHTVIFSRLRAPLGYWNALALVCALGSGVAIRLGVEAGRRLWVRLAGVSALFLLMLVGAMTYSRGGVIAFVVVVATLVALGPDRLRSLAVVALAGVAAAAPLAVAFTRRALTHDFVGRGQREHDGVLLAGVVALALAGLLVIAWQLVLIERRSTWSAARSRLAWRVLAGLGIAAGVAGVVALSLSARGFGGSISHQADSFTSLRKDPITDPSRLLTTNSGNRWVWWREAVGAWWDRPLHGWGAGSFPVTHLLYRKPPPLPVRQPHSVPLQFLAEDGLVGAALGVAALGALLAAALARLRRLPAGGERSMAVALLAGGLGWLVHSLYDWDWDIPGVTLPALCFLGVALAIAPGPQGHRRPPTWEDELRKGGGTRALALGVATLLLATIAVSAILPAWAHVKARDALAAAASPRATPATFASAQAGADLASRLDPLGDEGLIDAATIAFRRGLPDQERRYLLRAVTRDPWDSDAWAHLAITESLIGDRKGALKAVLETIALDPLRLRSLTSAIEVALTLAPPAGSATAIGTPLPPAPSASLPGLPGATGPAGATGSVTVGGAAAGPTGP
jgi:O-antigen ligase